MNENERTTRVAILTKGQLVGAVALDTNVNCPDGNIRHVVGSLDPRCNPPAHLRSYATSNIATETWLDAVTLSAQNGWAVAHIGERNYG